MTSMKSLNIPQISIPSENKDLWLNVSSVDSYISWYKDMKYRIGIKRGIKLIPGKKMKKEKGNALNYDKKVWRQVYYDLEDEDEDDLFILYF